MRFRLRLIELASISTSLLVLVEFQLTVTDAGENGFNIENGNIEKYA